MKDNYSSFSQTDEFVVQLYDLFQSFWVELPQTGSVSHNLGLLEKSG